MWGWSVLRSPLWLTLSFTSGLTNCLGNSSSNNNTRDAVSSQSEHPGQVNGIFEPLKWPGFVGILWGECLDSVVLMGICILAPGIWHHVLWCVSFSVQLLDSEGKKRHQVVGVWEISPYSCCFHFEGGALIICIYLLSFVCLLFIVFGEGVVCVGYSLLLTPALCVCVWVGAFRLIFKHCCWVNLLCILSQVSIVVGFFIIFCSRILLIAFGVDWFFSVVLKLFSPAQ